MSPELRIQSPNNAHFILAEGQHHRVSLISRNNELKWYLEIISYGNQHLIMVIHIGAYVHIYVCKQFAYDL